MKWTRPDVRGCRCCVKCHGLHTPQGQQQTLLHERQEYLARIRKQNVQLTGNEPVLQLLVLPITAQQDASQGSHDAMPSYSSTADFLSPVHCRFCLWDACARQGPHQKQSADADPLVSPVAPADADAEAFSRSQVTKKSIQMYCLRPWENLHSP